MSKINCAQIVYESIKRGFRLIDSAEVYKNENEAGQGIKRALDESVVKREDLDLYLIHYPVSLKYITPEEFNINPGGWIHNPNAVIPRMELDLGVTYQ